MKTNDVGGFSYKTLENRIQLWTMSDALFFQVNRYSQPPLILLGTVGALLNQALFFARKPLRSTSCALYFRALSANDLLVLYIVVLPGWLSVQFGIDPSKQYDWHCRLKTYLNNSLYTLSPYFIVMACFDRLCTSSTNPRLRRIATLRIASLLIPAMGLLVFLAYFHVPIWYTLRHTAAGPICTTPDPTYLKMISLFLFLFLCVAPPTLMTITCTITLVLLRQQRQRIMPVNQTRSRQRDNQLLKMLFIYVASHIVCTVPFTVTYVIFVFVPTGSPRLLLNLFRLFSLLFNVNFATSFYIYTLCTPFYRQELFNLLKIGQRRPGHPSTQGPNEGV
jgi:hypothetical protein